MDRDAAEQLRIGLEALGDGLGRIGFGIGVGLLALAYALGAK